MFFDENLIIDKIFDRFGELIKKNEQILISVSGGVDSIFLAYIIASYYKINYDISNVFCLIIDHDLREKSRYDASFARSLLLKMGYERVEIKKWEHEKILTGVEEKARNARHEIITEFCNKNAIKKVFLGHHLDDQLETFLMNAMRKSGTVGLGGMLEVSERNGLLINRPLLGVPKAKIIKFMQDNKIPWREDETNEDENFTRNKVRALISKLAISDEIYDKFAGTISAIQDVNSMIYEELDSFLGSKKCKILENSIEVSSKAMQGLAKPKKIYLIYKICERLGCEKKPRFDQIQELIFITSSIGSVQRKLYFCGLEIHLTEERVVFRVGG